MKKYLFIILMSVLCTMCSSGSEWQDVLDDAHKNPSQPVTPDEPAGETFIALGIFTDSHYSATKENKTERYYKASKQKIESAVATFNSEKVNMALSLGDIVDNEFDDYSDIAQYLDRLEMPFYKVLGNHDFVTPFSLEQQTAALKVLGISNRYFSVSTDDLRLIFLDGSDVAKYSNEDESEGYRKAEEMLEELKDDLAANAKNYNGAIGKAQRDWLDAELRTAQLASQNVICFSHIPLFVKDGEKYTLWNGEDVLDMLTPYSCVKAYVAGHHHVGGYSDKGGIHHITLKGMVQGPDNSYAIVRIYKDRIVIDGYGREEDREYKFR